AKPRRRLPVSATALLSGLRSRGPRLEAWHVRLKPLDEFADALRVPLAVAVADNGIGAARRVDSYLGPDEAGADVHRSHFGHGNTLFVGAEEARGDAQDVTRSDFYSDWEQQVPRCPSARRENVFFFLLV